MADLKKACLRCGAGIPAVGPARCKDCRMVRTSTNKFKWKPEYNRSRKSNPFQAIYNDKRWHRVRSNALQQNPTCIACELEHKTIPATVVDHVIPLSRTTDSAFDPDNLQCLCPDHHNYKTQEERKGLLIDYSCLLYTSDAADE